MVRLHLQALDKKLLRDLWRIKWQALAIALLVGAGTAVTVMAYSAQEALRTARDAYYAQTRFADVFVTLERAPLSMARRAAAIDGVTAVDPRIVKGGLSLVPGLVRPAQVRLVSLPADARAALNRVVVTRGRAPAAGSMTEALALQSFLEAAKLDIGDQMAVTVGGRLLRFRIVGAALSPEYIYVPGTASVMPDDAHNAILWVTRAALEDAAGMNGAFNAMALTLAPGARAQAVDRALEDLLGPYGVQPILFRKDQPSHAFLEGEFEELARSGAIFPPIFLVVAGALVHMVMMRLTEVQREEIGLLKAFGYSDTEAARPFVAMAALIAVAGAVIGGVAGAWLADAITEIYARYMRFPLLEPRFHTLAFAAAAGASFAAALAGAASAVRKVARLSPAVAMGPPRPARFRGAWLETAPFVTSLGLMARSIARNLERRPLRAVLTIGGLAASIALLLGTQFLFGAMDMIIDHSFYRRQRFSHQVTFVTPQGPEAMRDVRRLPGVLTARALRMTPATLSNGARTRRVAITGLDADDPLSRPLGADGRMAPLRPEGVLLTEALGRKLGVTPGDTIAIRLHERGRPLIAVEVTGFVTEYSGLSAYMDRRRLNRSLGEGDLANTAQIILDVTKTAAFYRAVAATPGLAGAISRDDTIAAYRAVIAEAFRTSRTYYAIFAALIAFGVAYNAGRIALSERARDLATLEVLGFTHGEIALLHLGEQAVLALAAIPCGLGLGWLLAQGIAEAYQRDEMRIPAVVDAEAVGVTLLVYGATISIVFALITYRLWRLNLVAVLKTRE